MSRRSTGWISLAVACLWVIGSETCFAITPELTSWIQNTDGHTGYGGVTADVQAVYYSNGFVYVECTGIPTYTIGPWGGPNTATNQGWRFKIARQPVENTGTRSTAPLGQIAVWRNGVVTYNPLDARSYQNQGVWHQNAIVAEAAGFDACLGHPAPSGAYHHHQNPRCLYSAADTTLHSPILGYAFDGFPIYGPYAFINADGSGGVWRMHSSYRLRNITQRTTLPDGTVLPPAQYGPAVSAQYPLGFYVEDFEYVAGLGDLNEQNGRVAVTPEYPAGTFVYHVTIDADGSSAYPYVLGPQYYGVVTPGNTGPGGGHVTIGEPVTRYFPAVGVGDPPPGVRLSLGPMSPNPAREVTWIRLALSEAGDVTLRVSDITGRRVLAVGPQSRSAGTHLVPLPLTMLAPGLYVVEARSGAAVARARVVVAR